MAGELRIGGIVLSCSDGFVDKARQTTPKVPKTFRALQEGNGRKRRGHRGGKARRKQQSTASSESDGDDEILQDYMEGCLSDDELTDASHVEAQESLNLLQSLMEDVIDAGPHVEDLVYLSDSVSESDNDLESESETSGPEDDALPMGSGDDSRDGEHSTPMPTQQDLMAMYPVLLNEPKMPTPGGLSSKKSSRQKQGTKGRDKHAASASQPAQLKREQKRLTVESKRTRRNADRGFNLDRINHQLHNLAASDTDLNLVGFAPMSKGENKQILQMASLYGLSGGEQCAKGNKRFVTVSKTKRSRLPEGKDKQKLSTLLKTFRAQLAIGSSAIDRATDASQRPGLGVGVHQKRGRNQVQKQQKTLPSEHIPGSSKKPLTFLSSGCLNDHEPSTPVIFTTASQKALQPSSEGCNAISAARQISSRQYRDLTSAIPPVCLNKAAEQLGTDVQRSGLKTREEGCLEAEQGRLESQNGSEEGSHLGLGYTGSQGPGSCKGLRSGSSGSIAEETTQNFGDQCLADVGATGSSFVDVRPELLLGKGTITTEFGCLKVFEDRGRHEDDESTGDDIQDDKLAERPIPSIFTTKKQHKKALKKVEKDHRRAARGSMGHSDMGHQTPALAHAAFEAHTRGVGSKIMAQMGYLGEGTGLGRNKQGISEPLKAHHRPKKLGLGA